MFNSLSVLKSISDEKGIDGATAEAIASVSKLLDEGLGDVESSLLESARIAPKPVSEIAAYILDAGGKRIRPALCILSAKAFSAEASPVDLAVVCELLHNATLLHDDVIDEGDMRRGKPSARMVWSNALSILGGDYMLMRCVEMISEMSPVCMKQFVITLKALVEGEIVQLRLRESVSTTRDDYFKIVNGKTSSLFGFATFSGATAGGASEANIREMVSFGQHIGVAFQLIDDVLDFSSDAEVLGKNLLSDISQGKMTLPVILAATSREDVTSALSRLANGHDAAGCAAEISHAVRQSGALDATREEATRHTELSMESLGRVSAPNAAVISILAQISSTLLHRGA